MSNPNFNPTMSSNDIWRDQDATRCLTDDLDQIEADIETLETDKADSDHTHEGYATSDHTHAGYAETGHSHSEYALSGHTHTGYANSNHTHTEYASTSHTHSGYASSSHGHSYNDLSDKPTIPSAYTHPSTHPASMITGMATVATSGSYNDLSNKPTIPTVPASLPANGGNADTVDGKHATDFALSGHTHSTDQNILWQGNYYMNASQTVTLSQSISAQRNGIVLVFSKFNVSNNESENTNIYCYFIPKQAVALFNGCGHTISEHNTASVNWLKYLYINDTTITGHALNAQYGTAANGVTYDNRERVLRYVIGV